MLLALAYFLVIAGGLLWGTIVLRFFWRRHQAREAIRRELAKQNRVLLRIQGASVFRDCGSIRAAFYESLSVQDYYAYSRAPDGSESRLWFEVVFVPLLGVVRQVRCMDDEEAGP